MRLLFNILYKEVLNTVKRPKRFLSILNKNIRCRYLDNIKLKLRFGDSWKTHYERDQAFRRKVYHTYEDYTTHQKLKLKRIDLSKHLSGYDIKYRAVLRERLEKANLLQHGMIVFCLGARLGTEIKSFLDLGCFAIGIDLNPGENNRYVVYGDFHDIQFPSNSVDVVFTNSLDHVFDIKRVIDEIKRLLKPNGLLILEVVRGSEEGNSPDSYESFYWSKIDDLVSLFENSQFRLIKRASFDYPWNGEHLSFKKER